MTDLVLSSRRHVADDYPAWIREIDYTLTITPQYVLTGNIRDTHLLPESAPGYPTPTTTLGALVDLFEANGYDAVLSYDLVDGLAVAYERSPGAASLIVPNLTADRSLEMTVARLGDVLRRVAAHTQSAVALIIDYGSRLRRSNNDLEPELHAVLALAQKLANASPTPIRTGSRPTGVFNTTVWLMDQEGDLPHWLASDGRVRVISIPAPTLSARREAAGRLLPSVAEYPFEDEARAEQVTSRFTELTHGMSLRSMSEIARLAIGNGIPVTRIDEAVRGYRVGVVDNPWKQPSVLDNIRRGNDTLGTRVLGQGSAIRKSIDILMRSSIGLTGAQSGGHASRPQGVLFFAGPTGVGKTELAKSLAELLFGTEDAYTRFDMSEFSSEHSEARLIGAPPGYVGHDAGGELTNAMRQRPFSIVLFDEIEKAHPRILDKFLQILEDGRLTDGTGSTVYFSDAVVIFTSNLGIYREEGGKRAPIVKPGEPYEELVAKVRAAIHDDFVTRIGRPELLNRIGDNIVVFDFISTEVGRLLVAKYLSNIVERVRQQRDIELEISGTVEQRILSEALTEETLAFGGRGIGAVVESVFINPLARAIFETDVAPGPATVSGLERSAEGWTVTLA
ncbi:AAA family ATPase [Agromyces allii]|uniref:AAA family ATPase n=1 Tax=Agromyces allii TaxID=393607 RepID=A0ABP5CSV5_9MICO|nr:AAA family ATPase [Agromyces allii]